MGWKPNPVVSNYIKIPKDILQLHKTVPVAADIIFFNRITFLVIISRRVKFTTVQYLGKGQQLIYLNLKKIFMMFTITAGCMLKKLYV